LAEELLERIVTLLLRIRHDLDEISHILARDERFSRYLREERVVPVHEVERVFGILSELRSGQGEVLNYLSTMRQTLGTIVTGVDAAFKVKHKDTDCSTGSDNAVHAYVEGDVMDMVCLGDTKEKWTVRGWDIKRK